MFTTLYSLGMIIIDSLEKIYNTLYKTKLKELVSREVPIIGELWEAIMTALTIGDITMFEFIIGTGITTWLLIGVFKFFKGIIIE